MVAALVRWWLWCSRSRARCSGRSSSSAGRRCRSRCSAVVLPSLTLAFWVSGCVLRALADLSACATLVAAPAAPFGRQALAEGLHQPEQRAAERDDEHRRQDQEARAGRGSWSAPSAHAPPPSGGAACACRRARSRRIFPIETPSVSPWTIAWTNARTEALSTRSSMFAERSSIVRPMLCSRSASRSSWPSGPSTRLRDELQRGGEADAGLDRRHEEVDELRHLVVDLLEPLRSPSARATNVGRIQPSPPSTQMTTTARAPKRSERRRAAAARASGIDSRERTR